MRNNTTYLTASLSQKRNGEFYRIKLSNSNDEGIVKDSFNVHDITSTMGNLGWECKSAMADSPSSLMVIFQKPSLIGPSILLNQLKQRGIITEIVKGDPPKTRS